MAQRGRPKKKTIYELSEEEKMALLLKLCIEDYRAYLLMVHGGRWILTKAAEYIIKELSNFLEKKTTSAYDILILTMPPQHGKSMMITETLPSWYLIKNPDLRVIEISYSEDFAQLFGRRNRQKINDYGKMFGIELAKSPNSNTEFEIKDRTGSMISRGVTSGITGRPCNLMIIDDPIKNRLEADSEVYRDRIWAEWQDSMKSRLSAGAKVILIQTRWHEDDLAGRIIKNERNVKVINLPCEAEEKDPLGRKPGEALCPEIGKGNEWLLEFKAGYTEGTRTWEALFQGHPSTEAGNIIKREWWKYYDELPYMPRIVISIDASFKDGDDNDYVAISVWGKRDANIYLIDMVHKHMDFIQTVNSIERLVQKYPYYNAIYVEDKANGSAVISYLRRKLYGLVAVNPQGGKIARVNAISGIIEAGNVYLPRNSSFTDKFIEECAVFPRGAHDDMVDSMSQALNREYFMDAAEKPERKKHSRQFEFYEPPNKNGLGKGAIQHVF